MQTSINYLLNNRKMKTYIEIPNYESYYLNPESKKIFKKDKDGLMRSLTPLKVGSKSIWRLTKGGVRTGFKYEELLSKVSFKF